MRYLILSDIHSNFDALARCLKVAEGRYDRVLSLGDLVGYGPDPNRVIERVRLLAHVLVRGNHDKACCGLMDPSEFNVLARLATQWTAGQLTPEHARFLGSLPPGPIEVEDFTLVHGSPADEDEYIFDSQEAVRAFDAMASPLAFFGHTHRQGGFLLTPDRRFKPVMLPPITDGEFATFPLESDCRYLINPGSVGQPRDGDWRAAFAIYDSADRCVEYYRTPYPLNLTQEKMRRAELPEPLVQRLEAGR